MKTIKQIEIKARRLPIAKEDRDLYTTKLHTPEGAAIMVRTLLGEVDEEQFVVVPLDIQNKPLGAQLISKGSPDACHVDPRTVFRAAIIMGASGIIVAHNHPSGDTSPSVEDLKLTERLIECGKLLGLPILDHLILTDGSHLSLREKHGGLWD